MIFSRLLRPTLWLIALVALAAAVVLRATVDFSADSPRGVALGAAAFFFFAMAALLGRLRRTRSSAISRFARATHAPLAVLALAAAVAHWHLRGRDYLGLTLLLLFGLVFLSSSLGLTRRYRVLRWLHKYAAYALLILAPFHGIRALFFPGS